MKLHPLERFFPFVVFCLCVCLCALEAKFSFQQKLSSYSYSFIHSFIFEFHSKSDTRESVIQFLCSLFSSLIIARFFIFLNGFKFQFNNRCCDTRNSSLLCCHSKNIKENRRKTHSWISRCTTKPNWIEWSLKNRCAYCNLQLVLEWLSEIA